ncbi:MAG: VanW family protein [Syntrophomonadaceae bacterium]|nr:VanW family protein [Syntrophomonadaceae bacterium]
MKSGVSMEGQDLSGLLPGEVKMSVQELALKYQRIPVDAALDKETGVILEDQDGISINIESSIRKIMAANPNQSLKLDTYLVHSKYNSDEIRKANKTLAFYETWLRGTNQRCTNISLAMASINNTLIWPGQVFSFNEIVGPRTPERGYQPGPIILMGTTELDYGGGVCQVASTIYNAALAAGVKIIERHPHSKPVGYVPEGKDASVSFDDLDLRFSNNYQTPLIVKSGISRGRIWVEIKGEGN